MKVIDFNEEEQLIKKDIERARANMKDVEDLSDFGSTKEKKTPEKKTSDSKKKMKKEEEEEPLTSKAIIKEVISVILNVLICFLVVFLITQFVGQRTVVSGRSMEDTLQDRDNLIVDKISYRFHDPNRFDVIIFPHDESGIGGEEKDTFYIKRVIGLPGETVRIDGSGNIYINDILLEETYGTEVMANPGMASNEMILGPDEYFVLGDNRNNSTDSRMIGPINRDIIVGKAWLRVYPFKSFGLVDNIE
ncbi:signal peptidase I [Pseudobutyrivibrio sp. NOR37]|nr:signal peptidase I [Pseudobutyrivibrio sp. NOR37]SFR65774.1 signal peptidase I [Pseudobutyrivibrio sp. NOR37]